MEQMIKEYSEKLATMPHNSDDFNYTSRKLIQMYIQSDQISKAKELLQKYYTFNRKDLLSVIMQVCKREESPRFAEQMLGSNIRCYSYVWMDFCVDLQKLYIENGEHDKAEVLAQSVFSVAFASLKPTMSALHKCITQSGQVVLGADVKRMYKELKQIEKEL